MNKVKELLYSRVAHITLEDNKTRLNIAEACDHYYYIDYNKQEFGELIEELKVLYSKMS